MEKQKLNYLVDVLMMVFFLMSAVSGLVLFLSEGGRRRGFHILWVNTKKSWIDFHKFSGLIFILLVLIHLILHWKWIVATTKSFFKKH